MESFTDYFLELLPNLYSVLAAVPIPSSLIVVALLPGAFITKLRGLARHPWLGFIVRWIVNRPTTIERIQRASRILLLLIAVGVYASANYHVVTRAKGDFNSERKRLQASVSSLSNDLAAERRYRSKEANEFAALQREGRKRYVEWWTDCFHDEKSREAERKAEQWRVKVRKKLTDEISLAEGEYFNTPRISDGFPVGTTAVYCPRGLVLNEHGHRVDRLGDVVQRIR